MGSCRVSIVEDDYAVRNSIQVLLEAAGYRVESYANAEDFLQDFQEGEPCFLVVDYKLSCKNGLQLFAELKQACQPVEGIMITGLGSFQLAIDAFRQGFQDVLEKPLKSDELFDRVRKGTRKLVRDQRLVVFRQQIQANFSKLSDRERQVKRLLVQGKANKCIALELGISEKTVETHRARLMQKLGLNNVQELVRISTVLQIDDLIPSAEIR